MNIILRRWVTLKTNSSVPYTSQYLVYTDGTGIWRKGVRDANFVFDHTLTPLGFSGEVDTDWENVFKIPK